MLTLNGTKFARGYKTFIQNSAEFAGYYINYKRSIFFFNPEKTKIGVINKKENVLGCATFLQGNWYYSHADIDLIGKFDGYTYSQKTNEIAAAIEAAEQ